MFFLFQLTLEDISLEPSGKVSDPSGLELDLGKRPGGGWRPMVDLRLGFGLLFRYQVSVHPSHQRLVVVDVALDVAGRVVEALANTIQLMIQPKV